MKPMLTYLCVCFSVCSYRRVYFEAPGFDLGIAEALVRSFEYSRAVETFNPGPVDSVQLFVSDPHTVAYLNALDYRLDHVQVLAINQ